MKPLTLKELAAHFRVTERTVYNWRKAGYVEAVRVGGTLRIVRVHTDRTGNPRQSSEVPLSRLSKTA